MREMFYDNDRNYLTILNEFNIERGSDFEVWWNNYSGEDEEADFLVRYSKLGQLLREGEQ